MESCGPRDRTRAISASACRSSCEDRSWLLQRLELLLGLLDRLALGSERRHLDVSSALVAVCKFNHSDPSEHIDGRRDEAAEEGWDESAEEGRRDEAAEEGRDEVAEEGLEDALLLALVDA